MPHLTRRIFLGTSATLAASTYLAPQVIARQADDTVRLAVIGLKGRGTQLLNSFEKLKGIKIVALCDVDETVLAREMNKRGGQGIIAVSDMRRIFARDDVDAVVIATPNHWHALAMIWAVESGKDVYVEKPVSWTITEGRRMVEATRKSGQIVAAGFQNRSDSGLRPFMEWLHAGNLGEIQSVRGLCYRRRNGIGKTLDSPRRPPENIEYDLWLGPADDLPLTRPNFHYDWHWIWNTGNGDFGNQGPHELDLMRWALGDPELPTSVTTFGGRFGWNDAGETPNMHAALFHGAGVPMMFEVRDLALAPKGGRAKQAASYDGLGVGIIIECEGGTFRGGRGGGRVYDKDGKETRHFKGDSGGTHAANFIDAVRSRKSSELRSEIENAHKSTALAHLANISQRTGMHVSSRELAGIHKADDLATDMFERYSRHLEDWDIDLKRTPWTAGGDLIFDPKTERYIDGDAKDAGNLLLTRKYRKGFVVPDKV